MSQVYSLPGQTEEIKKAFFGGAKKWAGLHREINPKSTWFLQEMKKAFRFVKFEIIPSPLCCLLDPLKNRYCKAWSSMINLWIDSMTCILLSPRERSNNYLGLSRENVLGEYDSVTFTMPYLKLRHGMVP